MSITHHPESISRIAQTLESIVGADRICEPQPDTAFGQQIAAALQPQATTAGPVVVYPHTPEELSAVVSCAHHHHWPFLPCGAGSKLHWGGLTTATRLVISTTRMNRLIDHAVGDLTLTAEAGIRFADVQATLGQRQQHLGLDPDYPQAATLGGIVATANTGALRQRYGGVRDMLIGISIVRADGKRVKAGGRVVKNVAGYDLMKLFTGSYGTLGVIDQLTFRVYPQPAASQTVMLTGPVGAIATVTSALLKSALSPTAIELLSASLACHLEMSTEPALVVRFQSLEVSVNQQANHLAQMAQPLGLSAISLSEAEEAALWKQLRESIEPTSRIPAITCKIGIAASRAPLTLEALLAIAPSSGMGVVHAASGLGHLRFSDCSIDPGFILEMRTVCESQGGFLTILDAPTSWKDKLDIWGYPGNALDIMKALKHQFDPDELLSPGRFISGL
jgi:glycolate oxidase FAD binding subunit